jgi:hypothetical protein
MTRPILRVDTNALPDEEFAVVEQLLHDLGVQGEELPPHVGVPEALDTLLVLSADSLHVVFDAMLAAAGGAAAAKLGEVLRRLPRRPAPAAAGEAQLVADRDGGGCFLVTAEAVGDPDAMTAMLHFDTALLTQADVLVWDSGIRKWRRRA